MNKINKIALVLLPLLVIGCKSLETSSGEKVAPFKGTIVYDVEVINNTDELQTKIKKALYGTEMHFTVFKNGDLQRKYNTTSKEGYDIQYLDVASQTILEKYNNSDSLFVHQAVAQNQNKLYDLRTTDEKVSILSYELKDLSIGAEDIATRYKAKTYLTIKYWYSEQLKVDKALYANVNDNLWSYFMNKSEGSLFLKMEVDYFTHKVVYTAKEIRPGKYDISAEELLDTAIRVED
ncbi:MAG: hypothetical protein ACI96L_000413 [Paracoccaceae bacterium]|jgi:hypothetical protein